MNELDKLKDIKSIVEIEDYSLYLLIFTSIIGVIIVIGVIYLLYRAYKNRQKRNKRLYYLHRIKKADINNPKKYAYIVTKYARLLVEDEKQERILEKLVENLEVYKYTDYPPEFSKESKQLLNLFIEVAHV